MTRRSSPRFQLSEPCTHRCRPAAPGRRCERGVSIVEAAFVTPVFFLLIFGVLEMGLLFNSYLSAGNMTRTSTRVASAVGDQYEADLVIMESIKKGDSSMVSGTLQTVVVFRATGPDSEVPEACKSASVAGECNRYTGADLVGELRLPPHSTQFGCGNASQDRFWCPNDRKRDLQGPKSPPDHVGVWVQVEHRYLTGIFGRTFTITDQVVMRMEPKLGEDLEVGP